VIDKLVDGNRIHIDGIVLAELMIGAQSQAEIDGLSHSMSGLKFVASDREAFLEAGRNGQILRRAKVAAPLTDVLVATVCIRHGLVLIESDRHYEKIAAHLPLKQPRLAEVRALGQ
jgi:predicted nucleic acid-binding protein